MPSAGAVTLRAFSCRSALLRSNSDLARLPATPATLAWPPTRSLDSLADASRSFCSVSLTLRPRCSPSTRDRISLRGVVQLGAVHVVARRRLGGHARLLGRLRLGPRLLDLRLEPAHLALLLVERLATVTPSNSISTSPFLTAVPLRTSFMMRRSPASDGAMIVIDRPAFTSPRICTASTNVPRSTTAVGTSGAAPRAIHPKPATTASGDRPADCCSLPRRVISAPPGPT